MKIKIITLAVLASLSGVGATAELTEFKKGDIATAEAFNKNFKAIDDATTSNTTSIETLASGINSQQTAIDDNTASIETLSSSIDSQQTTINVNTTEIGTISSSIDSQQTTINGNTILIGTLSSSIDSQQTAINANTTAITDLETSLANVTPAAQFKLYAEGFGDIGEFLIGPTSGGEGLLKYKNILYRNDDGNYLQIFTAEYSDSDCTIPIASIMDTHQRFLGNVIVSRNKVNGKLYYVNENSPKRSLNSVYYFADYNNQLGQYFDEFTCVERTNENGLTSDYFELTEVEVPDFFIKREYGEEPFINYDYKLSEEVYIKYNN